MAIDPRQRLAGGSGGIKGSAGANPSGMKALPNNNFIEGEFTRVNDKAIGPAKSIAPKIASNALSKVVGGIGAATMFKDAVSGYGVTPSDQRSPEGFQAPTFGKQASQSLPTSPKDELKRYQSESATRLATLPKQEAAIEAKSNPANPSNQFNTKSSSDLAGPPREYSNKIGDISSTQDVDGTLKIDLGNDRGGSIRFNDGRTLSPEKLAGLNKQIAFNNSEAGLASFAKNAELTNQRMAEAADSSSGNNGALGQLGALLQKATQDYYNSGSVTQRAITGHRLRNLEEIAIKAHAIDSDARTSLANTEFNARKYAGEAAFKGKQEADRQDLETYKMLGDQIKTGMLDPKTAIALLKRQGKPINSSQLGFLLNEGDYNEYMNAKDKSVQDDILIRNGFDKDLRASVLNEE